MFLIFRSVLKNLVEKLKIVVKNSEKLNCSYGKVAHDLKGMWYFTIRAIWFTQLFFHNF